jgi:hypothetical protein
MPVPVCPALEKFEVFDRWIMNGRGENRPDIIISGEDAVNGKVVLEAVTHMEYPPVIFSEAHAGGKSNGCSLVNLHNEAITTKGLFLSDSLEKLKMWEIPEISVRPGAAVRIVGKGGKNAEDLFHAQMTFKVKSGKVLFLSDGGGNLLDYIIAE